MVGMVIWVLFCVVVVVLGSLYGGGVSERMGFEVVESCGLME
jgi:hypothetical protein